MPVGLKRMPGWRAVFLRPPDGDDVVYEFFGPFAHLPGRYEWCRIHSPTHGVFDCFIVLGETTAVPATVYVASAVGEAYMRDRYPECTAVRADRLELGSSREGRTVRGRLTAGAGPVREADFALIGGDGVPEQVPYGGEGTPVWGSERFTCWGVDLNLPAAAKGFIEGAEGRLELDGEPGIVALGSFARIAPLEAP